MATVSIMTSNGEVKLDLLPETAAWSYAMRIQSFDTYDGRVVQLLACNIESLSIEGYIMQSRGGKVGKTWKESVLKPRKSMTAEQKSQIASLRSNIDYLKNDINTLSAKIMSTSSKKRKSELTNQLNEKRVELARAEAMLDTVMSHVKNVNRTRTVQVERFVYENEPVSQQWQGMRDFEEKVKTIMETHASIASSGKGKSVPAKFRFSEVGWYGDVYLVGYNDVRYEPDIPAVRYTLKFEVAGGFDTIREAASSNGLENIADGVGWVRNVYNTPTMSWESVKEALGNVIDDAGTHDASNPADFLKYLEEAQSGSSDGNADGAKNVDSDEGFIGKMEKVIDGATKMHDNMLIALGLVGKKK